MADNRNTKKKITETAFALFSANGYDGTALQDIADTLGVTKTALYRHYKSKDDIWNNMLDALDEQYTTRFHNIAAMPVPANGEELLQLSLTQIAFTLHDEKISQARRLLTMEQFRNSHTAALATKHFITGISEVYESLFIKMAQNGIMKQDDFALLAMEYVAPITLLIHLCDREPQREQEALERISAHIRRFIKLHGVKQNDR